MFSMNDASTPSESITIPKSAVRRVVLIVAALAVLAIIAVAAFALARTLGPKDSLASGIKSNEYQAVVLTNGQIYFGKLSAPGGDFYYLRHVYYLTQTAGGSGRPLQRTLARLTNDVHGPEDFMIINRSQIAYVENLRPDGRAARLMSAGGGP